MFAKIKILFLLLVVAAVGFYVWQHHQNSVRLAETAAKVQEAKTTAAAELAGHCLGNTIAKEVIVSISKQHMWGCKASKTVYDTAVTTGASAFGDDTLTGTWQIQDKQTNRYLKGSDSRGSWNDFVKYWIPYDGDYGFHDASWQTFPFGDLTKYKTDGSHGCVHMPLTAIEWMYNWAPIGTTVTIQS